MQKLQASGIKYPLHTFSSASRNTVYHLASWLWQRGGEFIDGDGKVAFHHPQALQGITDYFRLFPFIDPARPHSFFNFAESKAAVVIENPGVLAGLQDSGLLPPEILAHLGVAALPGPSFVGGTDMVIWQHTPYEAAQAASAFITGFLMSETYLDFAYNAHYLPALRSAARDPRWADPRYQMMFDIAQQGRSHYGSHLWVMLADRMAVMAEKTFNELFAAPAMTQAEVTALVSARVESLATRLENAIH